MVYTFSMVYNLLAFFGSFRCLMGSQIWGCSGNLTIFRVRNKVAQLSNTQVAGEGQRSIGIPAWIFQWKIGRHRHSTAGRVHAAFTLIEVLVVISITLILTGMLIPAIHAVRESARRTECSNRLRQISMSSLNFQTAVGHLPHTWYDARPDTEQYRFDRGVFLSILPFLEEISLAGQFSTEHPAPSLENRNLIADSPPLFRCPSVPIVGSLTDIAPRFSGEPLRGQNSATCDYTCNGGFYASNVRFSPGSVHTVVAGVNHAAQLHEITGGLSNTFFAWESAGAFLSFPGRDSRLSFDDNAETGYFMLLVGALETRIISDGAAGTKSYAYAWMGHRTGLLYAYDEYGLDGDPARNPRFNRTINFANNRRQPFSPHPGVCVFAMLDGSVRTMQTESDAFVVLSLATREID